MVVIEIFEHIVDHFLVGLAWIILRFYFTESSTYDSGFIFGRSGHIFAVLSGDGAGVEALIECFSELLEKHLGF